MQSRSEPDCDLDSTGEEMDPTETASCGGPLSLSRKGKAQLHS